MRGDTHGTRDYRNDRLTYLTLSASQSSLALATRECVFLGRGAVRGESRAVPTKPAGNSRRAGRTTTGNG